MLEESTMVVRLLTGNNAHIQYGSWVMRVKLAELSLPL